VLELPAEGLSERKVDLVCHDLDNGDIVPLYIAAAAPKALAGRADEGCGATELVRQFLQSSSKCARVTGWPVPVLVGMRICTRYDAGLMMPCAPALFPASFQEGYSS
jgi:hypothetical protein